MPNTPEGTPQRGAPRHSGPAVACVGCLSLGVLGLLGALLALAIYSRDGAIPEPFNSLARIQECTRNLTDLSAALKRYHNKNGQYPAALEDLYPDYLKSSSVLWCPLAMPRKVGAGYEYQRPPADASGSVVAIRCLSHEMRTGRVVLEGHVDGSVSSRHEGLAEAAGPARPGSAKKPSGQERPE